jgi:hypothetical protein
MIGIEDFCFNRSVFPQKHFLPSVKKSGSLGWDLAAAASEILPPSFDKCSAQNWAIRRQIVAGKQATEKQSVTIPAAVMIEPDTVGQILTFTDWPATSTASLASIHSHSSVSIADFNKPCFLTRSESSALRSAST